MRRFVNQLATAGVFVFAALVTPDTGGAMAQPGRQGEPCDGKIVSAVEIRARGPRPADTSTVQGTLQEVERSRHTPTRHEVIAAYLRLVEGRPCTELDRSESERVLRAQPFLSYATVRTRPDGAGRVRVEVETIDELPILLGGGVRRGSVSGLMLGSGNLGGRGLTLALSYENGFHYRDGFGVRAVQYGTFGRPYTLGVTAIRHPLGESGSLVLTEPFLSDLQPRGFHTGFASAGDYYRIVRPTGEDLALYVRRMAYDFMILTRVNPVGSGGLVGLVGAAVLGEDIRTGTSTVIVSDSGLLAASAGAQFGPGFGGSSATRLAVVGGVRQVRFFTVRGFDALSAEQDVARGFQFDALAGPAVRGLSLVSDLFVSSGVYWGAGNANSFVQLRAIAEGRADTDTTRGMAWSWMEG